MLQHRNRQRNAFARIGPGSQLIQQQQRPAVSRFDHRSYVRHMGGKGAERLLDILPVTKIGH
ncbi:hypothetical protein D3C84_1135890 [compost metagenome]